MSFNQTKRSLELLNRRSEPGGSYRVYADEGRYGRQVESPSPFVLRGLPPLQRHEKPGPRELVFSEIGYRAARSTGREAFVKRGQRLPAKPPWPGRRMEVAAEERLVPHHPALRFYLNQFLRQTLNRMELDPAWLEDQARRMREALEAEGLEVPRIEAFEQVTATEDFRALLQALIQQDLPHKLELATALIQQFAARNAPQTRS